MPGQLFYDTQASVKNAYFCVGKQKVLDPTKELFIGQSGSDRLEEEFGNIRTAKAARM